MTSIPRTPEEYREWWGENTDVPFGFCWCGCENKTSLAKDTAKPSLLFKGQPKRFLHGHTSRVTLQIDLSGKKFNEWTVIGPTPSGKNGYWLSRCSCGIEKEVHGGSLRSGTSKSCGHGPRPSRILNLTGKRFNKLVARRRLTQDKKTLWECDCDCGNSTTVAISNLTTGNTKSCGCWSSRNRSREEGGRVHDLTGQRFGSLVALEAYTDAKNIRRWTCRCDCGGSTSVATYHLTKGLTVSCGCKIGEAARSRMKLKGEKIGELTILLRMGLHEGGDTQWLCRCSCGVELVVAHIDLANSVVTDCGCRSGVRSGGPAIATSHPYWTTLLKTQAGRYKVNAKKRGLQFNLTLEHFEHLLLSHCYYCGKEPSREISTTSYEGSAKVNGVDRLDSSGNYDESNVVACCWECNWMKGPRGHDEFLGMARRIAYHTQDINIE